MKYKLKDGVGLPIYFNYSGLHPDTWSRINGGEAVELTETEFTRLKDRVVPVKDAPKTEKEVANGDLR
jgi:hypothetical protein